MEFEKKEKYSTIVDTGWRREDIFDASKTTIFDEGWRNRVNNILDPDNVENKATSNYFPTISKFKEIVSQISQLKSEKNIYIVKNTLSNQGGESVVLLCTSNDGKSVVAKIYYEPINSGTYNLFSRSKVLEYMSTEEGQKYTLTILDTGVIEFGTSKYYFEIMPYVADGDISDDGEFSFEEICKVTEQLNEAIHSIHNFGLLHRDIKPSNIFKINGRYVLGDFGVAKNVGEGKSDFTRHTVGTDGFIAPELRLSLSNNPTFKYSKKCDYYSLGVTLGSLFEGHFVYENVTDEMMLTCVQNSNLPLTREDSKRVLLENLLFHGLVNFDPTNRFGYEDVCKWLENYDYIGTKINSSWPKSINFLGKKFNDEQSLFLAITQNEESWNEAKAFLYTKTFEEFFKSFRTDLSRESQKIDEQYRNTNEDKGLLFFLKTLFPQGHIVWKGYNFHTLVDLGNAIMDSRNPNSYADLFQNNIISHWLTNTEGISFDENRIKLVNKIEKIASQESELACYWFGFSFATQDKKILNICNKSISSYNELVETIFSSPEFFYREDVISKIFDRKKGADLYGFLYYLGYTDNIDACWNNVKQKNEFDKLCILFSLMDGIAESEKVNTKIIRDFFVKYGPVGYATYTKMLVDQNVYISTNSECRNIISKIQNFKEPTKGNVNELFNSYLSLIKDIDVLKENLFDNPLCISAGIYENKGLVCTNVIGCFVYDFFGKTVPIGFNSFIKNSNDVKNSILKTNETIPKVRLRRKLRFVYLIVFFLSLVVCMGIGFSIYQINPSLISSLVSSDFQFKIFGSQSEYKECYVLSDALNIRREPKPESEIVITVMKSTKLKVYSADENNVWVRVKFNDKTGYVNKKFLTVNKGDIE